jgi:hypothetical protein
MIQELTKDNLLKCGLSKDETENLLNAEHGYQYQTNSGNFYISQNDRTFYTGVDFWRQVSFNNGEIKMPYGCPDLIPEYFELALVEFLNTENLLLDENEKFDEFISIEIKKAEKRMEILKKESFKNDEWRFEFKENQYDTNRYYITFLKRQTFKPEKSEPYQISKEDIFEMQNNLITNINIEDVFKHFEILTKTTNKQNKFYLRNEQLLIFIKSTFVDLKPLKQDFNCKTFVKKNIRKVFYDFYLHNKNKETNQTSIKRKYFKIMNDAFNGFNENDYTDFAK